METMNLTIVQMKLIMKMKKKTNTRKQSKKTKDLLDVKYLYYAHINEMAMK